MHTLYGQEGRGGGGGVMGGMRAHAVRPGRGLRVGQAGS